MDPSLLCIIFDCHPTWPQRAHSETSSDRAVDAGPKIDLNQVLKHTAVFINAFWLCNRNNKLIALANSKDKTNVCFPAVSSTSSRSNSSNSKVDYIDSFSIDPDTHKIVVASLLNHCTISIIKDEYPHAAESTSSGPSTSTANHASTSPAKLSLQHVDSTTARIADVNLSTVANTLSLSLCMINKLMKMCKQLKPRILVVQNSPDYSQSYYPLMNAVFSADKLDIPVDTIVLSNEPSTLMQQASYVTGGVHFHLPPKEIGDRSEVYLQRLMTYVLPNKAPRKAAGVPRGLIATSNTPSQTEIDFRASCWCHQEKRDIVNMCSVCLSLFCEQKAKCPVCHIPVNQLVAPNK